MRKKNHERDGWHILVNKGTNSNSYVCYPDLGSDNYQYGISKLIPQTSFRNETSDGFTECRLFSQAQLLRAHWSKMWEISILLRSNDHGS